MKGKSLLKVKMMDIDLIRPNKNQPRSYFDSEKIDDLAESIVMKGIIQPILVKKTEDHYEIIAGERRWRAAMNIGLGEVPAIIMEVNSIEQMELAIMENLQREGLNAIEEAKAFKIYLDETKRTHEELSEFSGKSRPYISNAIRLLNLPDEIQAGLIEGKISSGHGRALLSIKNAIIQMELYKETQEKNLSVRELEDRARDNKKETKERKQVKKDIFVMELEQKLTDKLGNKVSISTNMSDKKGSIKIDYYDNDDLDRLIKILEKE